MVIPAGHASCGGLFPAAFCAQVQSHAWQKPANLPGQEGSPGVGAGLREGGVHPAPRSGRSQRARVQILPKACPLCQGLSAPTRQPPGARVRSSERKPCGDEADPSGGQRPASRFPGRLWEEVMEGTGLPVDPGAVGDSPPPLPAWGCTFSPALPE